MDISVKGKHLDVGDALRAHVEEQLGNVVTKYFTQAIDAAVTFSREGNDLKADISVHPGPRGLVVQGSAEGGEAYGAFDGALERIGKQLRRYKRRLSDHHRGRDEEDMMPAQQYVLQAAEDDVEEDHDGPPAIVAEMETEIATLSVGEAVMRMDLADAPLVMFRNSGNGGLNVVYRRADGNIGWIDPANTQ